jgi:hypothetical protein
MKTFGDLEFKEYENDDVAAQIRGCELYEWPDGHPPHDGEEFFDLAFSGELFTNRYSFWPPHLRPGSRSFTALGEGGLYISVLTKKTQKRLSRKKQHLIKRNELSAIYEYAILQDEGRESGHLAVICDSIVERATSGEITEMMARIQSRGLPEDWKREQQSQRLKRLERKIREVSI